MMMMMMMKNGTYKVMIQADLVKNHNTETPIEIPSLYWAYL